MSSALTSEQMRTPATGSDVLRLAAIFPPITLAFVFNFLLVACQRKLDRGVMGVVKRPGPASPFDELEMVEEDQPKPEPLPDLS